MTLAIWWWIGQTAISVVNETGQELEALVIGFPGRTCEFRAIPSHAARTCGGRAERDGYISVAYRLRGGGGTTLDTEEYVNFTLGWRGMLILRPEGKVEAHREK
jgi:hypothetical protein